MPRVPRVFPLFEPKAISVATQAHVTTLADTHGERQAPRGMNDADVSLLGQRRTS